MLSQKIEPGLFKKVTGLDVKDFELLVSIGLFNDSLMNDAVYKFKRYEDDSLSYTGVNRHEGEDMGGWDTVISDAEYNAMFSLQQASMAAPERAADDVPVAPALADYDDEAVDTESESAAVSAKRRAVPVTRMTTPIMPRPTPIPQRTPVPFAAFASQTASPKQETPTVDYSAVKAGTVLQHKAFGEGMVRRIEGGLITVAFGKAEKKFQFPGAFLQGFLRIT